MKLFNRLGFSLLLVLIISGCGSSSSGGDIVEEYNEPNPPVIINEEAPIPKPPLSEPVPEITESSPNMQFYFENIAGDLSVKELGRLHSGELDFIIHRDEITDSAVLRHLLFTDEWVFIANSETDVLGKIGIAQLKNYNYIAVESSPLPKILEDKNLTRNISICVPVPTDVKLIIEATTNCLAMIPRRLAAIYVEDNPDLKIVDHSLKYDELKLSLNLYWLKATDGEESIRYLQQEIKNHCLLGH